MMVDPVFTRYARGALAAMALALLVLFARVDMSTGTVVGQPLAFSSNSLTLAIQAPAANRGARLAEIRATKIVRARCLRTARTAAQRKPCRSQKVSLAIRRLATQSTPREVVCHKGVGNGTTNWVAIPPAQTSAHIPGHQDDFIIFADYPDGAVWSDLKPALDAKCACAGSNPTIEPVAPTKIDVCGTKNDTYTIPTTVGVRYMIDGQVVAAGTYPAPAGGTVTIIAVAIARNVVLSGTATWTFTFTDAPCVPIEVRTPPAPSVSPKCGPNNDVVTLPESMYFTYASSGWSMGEITVIATPKPGVVVADGAKVKWVFRDYNEPCVVVAAPRAPSVSPKCGPNNDVVTLPESSKFTYTASGWDNNVQTVRATPKPGVVVKEGATTEWTFTDSAESCEQPPVVAPAPSVSPKCGPNNDGVTLPANPPEGVSYTVGAWSSNSLTVTATAGRGVTLAEPSTWTFKDAATVCPARLAIRKTGPGVATAKQPVRYTITVTNVSGASAYNVVVRDFVPAGMVLVSVPASGTMSGGAAQWSVGTLAAGASRTLSVTMRPAANLTVTRCNSAQARGSNAPAVGARACTRFVKVAGVRKPGVTG